MRDGRRRSEGGTKLDPYFLAGAIVGSGLYVFLGREPARRLIAQGGVKVNGERVEDSQAALGAGAYLVKVGKRRFVKLKIG